MKPTNVVTNWSAHQPAMRLNAISPYFTMFPLAFPGPALADASPNEWVLDPFCGRGTTLFAARTMGLAAVGIDTNKVAVATSTAKLRGVGPTQVIALAANLLASRRQPTLPVGQFWRYCFATATLKAICRLRESLITVHSPEADVLRALVLGVLHGPIRLGSPTFLSNQMPRTYATKPESAVRYWRQRGLEPPTVDVLDVIRRRAEFTLSSQPPAIEGSVHLGDARQILPQLDQRFSRVITSPPYLGMRTYVADQWLRHWFLGGPETVEYSDPDSIRSSDPETFATELGEVFRLVAAVCEPRAKLTIRFGALPSVPCDPAELLKESLSRADAGWTVQSIQFAGVPKKGMRQASQMGARSATIEEVDCHAVLT